VQSIAQFGNNFFCPQIRHQFTPEKQENAERIIKIELNSKMQDTGSVRNVFNLLVVRSEIVSGNLKPKTSYKIPTLALMNLGTMNKKSCVLIPDTCVLTS